MKISYNWLRQFLQTDWEAEKTGELLTDLGLEVEGIEKVESIKGSLKGIVVGEVKTCVKHPNADKLKITTVDLGDGNPVQIVCGAPNIAKGQKVRLKLNNYPYQEFGQLIGEVTNISLIPTTISETQNAYFITISLPQDLITTYKKEITFTPEMTGTAEIITEDLRLLDRIFNKFRKVLDK